MIATVILGSNSGNRREIIDKAVSILSVAGQLISSSSFYETEPWGFESTEQFLNKVAVLDTAMSPEAFLKYCLETEKALGRTRTPGVRYSSRTIDIDILFCDQQIINTPDLTVPHPRIAERNFVLAPLNEIMPDFIHPVLHKKISGLLSLCPDKLAVKRII